jgi:hypothetical protein
MLKRVDTRKIIFCICGLLLASCEEIVTVDIPGQSPKIVIDATISDTIGKAYNYVLISKSTSYNDRLSIPRVSGAQITLTEINRGANLFYNFREDSAGYYVLTDTTFKVKINALYRLAVVVNNQIFEAENHINQRALIDSISFNYKENDPYFDIGYYPIVYFKENKGKSYYRWRVFLNNKLFNFNEITLMNDNGIDGQYLNYQLLYNFKENDTIRVDLYSLSEASYNYYTVLKRLTEAGSPTQGSPGNPVSNFSGDVLGFFSVNTVSSYTAIVKKP